MYWVSPHADLDLHAMQHGMEGPFAKATIGFRHLEANAMQWGYNLLPGRVVTYHCAVNHSHCVLHAGLDWVPFVHTTSSCAHVGCCHSTHVIHWQPLTHTC
jgi:hypothetical protein